MIATPRYAAPEPPTAAAGAEGGGGGADVPANQLDLMSVELAQDHAADAARRLDALLRDSSAALLPITEQANGNNANVGVMSLLARLELMPAEQKTRLRDECERQFGEAAARMLSRLQQSNVLAAASAEPARLLDVVARYPFTRAADAALSVAAQRAADLGDDRAADDLRALVADHARPSTTNSGASRAVAFHGVVPFAPPWFGDARSSLSAPDRLLPVFTGGNFFLATNTRVLAFKETGTLLWSVATNESTSDDDGEHVVAEDKRRSRSGRSDSSRSGPPRAPTYAPDVFCDSAGTPRVLVVRQPATSSAPGGASENQVFALRALRAEDGRVLWSSDDRPELRGLTIASNPAVAGRYVYALAVDPAGPGAQADRLVMLALNLTDGRVLWRCDAGSVARRQVLTRFTRARDPVLDAGDPWQHLSAPGVSRDLVVVAPNCGAVIAINRFDGRLRWVRTYEQAQSPPSGQRELRDALSRWTTTPCANADSSAVLVAPLDADRLVSLDARSGRKLWHTDDLGAATLVGTSGAYAIVADSSSVTALDPTSGEVRWTWSAGGVAGLVAVEDDAVFIPTSERTVLGVSATDGKPVTSQTTKPPDFGAVLKAETGSAALKRAGATDSLRSNGSSDDDDVRKDKPRSPNRPGRPRS